MKFAKFLNLRSANKNVIVPAFERSASTRKLDFDLSRRLFNEADKIQGCGSAVKTIKCAHCGTDHFKGFIRCKGKFCALCTKAKAMLWCGRLFPYLKEWLKFGHYVVFLNFTIRDTETLEEGLETLQEAWRYMTGKHKQVMREFKKRFVGGFKSLEVKKGENSGKWHPHFHCLTLKAVKSKDTEFLADAWIQSVGHISGDYGTIKPYIKAFTVNKVDGKWLTDEAYNLALLKSIMEVCKYIVDFDYVNGSPDDVAEMFEGLRGARQYSTWGVLYNIQKKVDKDLDQMSNDEIVDFVCQECGCTKGAVLTLFENVWRERAFSIRDYSRKKEIEPDPERVAIIRRYNNKEKLPPLPEDEQLAIDEHYEEDE